MTSAAAIERIARSLFLRAEQIGRKWYVGIEGEKYGFVKGVPIEGFTNAEAAAFLRRYRAPVGHECHDSKPVEAVAVAERDESLGEIVRLLAKILERLADPPKNG